MDYNCRSGQTRQEQIRGQLHELSIQVPRCRKAVTRMLRQAQERMDTLHQMEQRQRQLEHELHHVKEIQ